MRAVFASSAHTGARASPTVTRTPDWKPAPWSVMNAPPFWYACAGSIDDRTNEHDVAHAPPQHDAAAPHACPHAPQFAGSLDTSTRAPPQTARGAAQPVSVPPSPAPPSLAPSSPASPEKPFRDELPQATTIAANPSHEAKTRARTPAMTPACHMAG